MPAAKKKPVAQKKPASFSQSGPSSTAGVSAPKEREEPVEQIVETEVPAPAATPAQPIEESPGEESSATSESINLEQVIEDSAVEDPPLEKTNKALFALGTVIALGLIVGSIAIFLLYLSHPRQVIRQEVVPVEEASPSATPMATNKSDITVEVLNGSGVAGTAGKAADTLSALGYTIGKTGNAEKRLTKSEVLIAASLKEDGVTMLLADLEKEFSITSSSGVLEDSTFSARVTIGKQ